MKHRKTKAKVRKVTKKRRLLSARLRLVNRVKPEEILPLDIGISADDWTVDEMSSDNDIGDIRCL